MHLLHELRRRGETPVIVLTNREVFSMGEDFLLQLSVLPHVTVEGRSPLPDDPGLRQTLAAIPDVTGVAPVASCGNLELSRMAQKQGAKTGDEDRNRPRRHT